MMASSLKCSIRCFRPIRVRPRSLRGSVRQALRANRNAIQEEPMSKFIVAPHFRLQEWVAEEKDYFATESLDYEFRETMGSSSAAGHQIGNKVGAYQTFEAGRTCHVSGACHWTMNVAASNGHA